MLIPTFSNIINKANESADLQTVKNLNTILASEQTVADAPAATMSEALAQAQEGGYVVDKLSPTGENNDILWEQNSNRFVLADKNGNILYKDNITEGGTAQGGNFWKITGDEDAVKAENNAKGFSYYLKESFSSLTFTAAAGIDVGENDEAFDITYTNESETAAAQPVVFRTNAASSLTVNAPYDTVYHYGEAGNITVEAVAGDSYHEYGEVTSLTINKGRLVVESGVTVPELTASPAEGASIELDIRSGAEIPVLIANGENITITNDGNIGTYSGDATFAGGTGTQPSKIVFETDTIDGLFSVVGISTEGEMPSTLTIPSKINGQTVQAIGAGLVKSEMIPGFDVLVDKPVLGSAQVDTVILPDTVKEIRAGAFKQSSVANFVLSEELLTIGDRAFWFNSNLQSISIPDSVETLGNQVFYWCIALQTAVIGNGLTVVPDGTFEGCSGLHTVEIGKNLQKFDSGAVQSVETFVIDENNEYYKIIGDCLIEYAPDGSSATLIWADKNCTAIPNGVTAIGSNVFKGRTDFTGALVIPNSVTSIGESAFNGCTGITSIDLGDGVVTIGDGAFRDCSGVESLHIGKNVKDLIYYSDNDGGNTLAFFGLTSLTEITVSSESENYVQGENCVLSKDGKTLVLGCKATVIPATVTAIGDYAFAGKGLTDIALPNSITSIGEYAFHANEGFSGELLDLRNVTVIKQRAFMSCGTFESIILNKDITSIGPLAFPWVSGTLYFTGNAEEWKDFFGDWNKGQGNEGILNKQDIAYYSESEPPADGNAYWHYVDDQPVIYGAQDSAA